MSRSSKQVLSDLKNGVIPDELNFKPKPQEDIDWNMVKYNSFYKSPEFFEAKFGNGMNYIPGFDKVIDMMVANAKTPLQEIELRQEQGCQSSER